MTRSEFTVRVHDEGQGTLWAEVVELPGCFVTGDSQDELLEGLAEAIALYRDQPVTEASWLSASDRAGEQRLAVAG